MTRDKDLTREIAERAQAAHEAGTPLEIRGGGSKRFYGREPAGEALELSGHRGLVDYEPSELVLTARAGTPLEEIERRLAEAGQMLPFEPPRFAGGATLGGAVAAGLSGPRRPFSGAVRDMVLGVRIVNGRGEVLGFGGRVMKNVAGYDLSRLMAGSLGTLGVLLEVSVKVLPLPESEHTMALEIDPGEMYDRTEEWLRAGFPLSATAHADGRLFVRLAGARAAVEEASRRIGGERVNDAPGFWRGIRDHAHPFFAGEGPPLWRMALAPAAGPPRLSGPALLEWGGRLAWLRSDANAPSMRSEAESLGGHATLFRGGDRNGEVFHPLDEVKARLHRRLKQSFDPAGILNPGRLYAKL